MNDNLKLFPGGTGVKEELKPLAERMRPSGWEEFEGAEEIDQNLLRQIREGRGRPPSLILWGPPGSGKTTFAKLVGRSFNYNFVELSAVLGGVKEVREIIAEAAKHDRPTILFLDEIHRFNKAQQDAFLPHVEGGGIILIGATTENPSFYLNTALLSRCRVVTIKALAPESLSRIADRAAAAKGVSFTKEARDLLVEFADGDGRRLINLTESFIETLPENKKKEEVDLPALRKFIEESRVLFYDRSGEEHYNVVSAFIKSMRGSDPDAALYWGFRMLEAGEDPLFIIRRMIIFASEDIGNADPRALQMAVATLQAFESIGLPEGRIPIAHCITYLASAPKSNRSYMAMHAAIDAVKRQGRADVPLHLRNAPTGLMKKLGYGSEYQYPHDQEGAFAAGVQYLPDKLKNSRFYEPDERGYEKNIKERLDYLRALNRKK